MLWLSMLYTVFRIAEYSTHRGYFLAATCVIFAIPLSIACFLLMTPYPRFWRRRLIEVSEGRPCKSSEHYASAVTNPRLISCQHRTTVVLSICSMHSPASPWYSFISTLAYFLYTTPPSGAPGSDL